MKYRKGFTLIELLVVIAIIAVLISLLVPSIQGAMERGREIGCRNNLRNIGIAMLAYASDNHGSLPGSVGVGTGGLPSQKSFMGKEVLVTDRQHMISGEWRTPIEGRYGTLYPYLGGQTKDIHNIYRCPSLPLGVIGSGVGSNGMFDYAMIKSFGGARISAIPQEAVIFRGTAREQHVRTPLVLEEDPAGVMNFTSIEPGHSTSGDRMGRWHSGGRAFYVAVDGSVNEVRSEGNLGPNSHQWEVRIGQHWHHIGHVGTPYGRLPW